MDAQAFWNKNICYINFHNTIIFTLAGALKFIASIWTVSNSIATGEGWKTLLISSTFDSTRWAFITSLLIWFVFTIPNSIASTAWIQAFVITFELSIFGNATFLDRRAVDFIGSIVTVRCSIADFTSADAHFSCFFTCWACESELRMAFGIWAIVIATFKRTRTRFSFSVLLAIGASNHLEFWGEWLDCARSGAIFLVHAICAIFLSVTDLGPHDTCTIIAKSLVRSWASLTVALLFIGAISTLSDAVANVACLYALFSAFLKNINLKHKNKTEHTWALFWHLLQFFSSLASAQSLIPSHLAESGRQALLPGHLNWSLEQEDLQTASSEPSGQFSTLSQRCWAVRQMSVGWTVDLPFFLDSSSGRNLQENTDWHSLQFSSSEPSSQSLLPSHRFEDGITMWTAPVHANPNPEHVETFWGNKEVIGIPLRSSKRILSVGGQNFGWRIACGEISILSADIFWAEEVSDMTR